MKRFVVTASLLFSMLILCGETHLAFSAEKIRYVGCGIVKKAFMAELAKEFTRTSGIEVDIEGGGATRGIRAVASGDAVLGGTCRHALEVPEENGVKLHHVAWDALAVIVNKNNPVDSISLEQLKSVVEGRIKDWGELGGPANTPLEFYARKGTISGVGLLAREIIFNDTDKEFTATKFFKSTGPLERDIGKNKWAIGLTGISSARKADVKILKLNNISMSKQNIAAGKYLLYRPLYLVTKAKPDELAAKFIEFAKSRKGQQVISRQETVNIREGGKLWRLYRKQ
jgi:phosphate transport system substrate-binding protein